MSRPVHGVLDYVIGFLLAFSPSIFGFKHQHLAPEFAVVFGAGMILYSLLTNYELGLVRLLPFRVHRFLDFCVSIVLLLNWISFSGRAGVVFTIFGIVEFMVALFTRNVGRMKIPGML